MEFSLGGGEKNALHSLIGSGTSDIFLKTDRMGFIVHASAGFDQLGFNLQDELVGPNLADLINPAQREAVSSAFRATLMGFDLEEWIEFRAAAGEQRGKRFEIRMRCLRDDNNRIAGALAMIRGIEDRKALEEKLFAAEMTCALTGLTNRRAFAAMLSHLVAEQVPGCLAMVSMDHLKAINMRYGQSTGDQVLVTFANFLRSMVRPEDIVSRFGAQSFAILLPGADLDQAEDLCRTLVATLAELGAAPPDGIPINASAGVAEIGLSLDETIKQAELALIHAKTLGRSGLKAVSRAPVSLTHSCTSQQYRTLAGRFSEALPKPFERIAAMDEVRYGDLGLAHSNRGSDPDDRQFLQH